VGDAIGICGSFRSASKDLARDLNDAVHKDAGRKRRRAKKELISSADQKITRTSTIRLGTVAEAVLKQPSHP